MDQNTIDEPMNEGISYTGIVKYSVLIFLYFFTFIYIYKGKSQFLFYICVFVLNFFLLAFILNDIYSNKYVMDGLSRKNASLAARVSVYAIIIGGLGQFIGLLISLIVFGYATHQVKKAKKYSVIDDFKDVLFQFKTAILVSTFFIGLVAFLLIYMYSPEAYREYLKTIVFLALIVGIFGLVGYELKLAVDFLRVKQKKLKLYNIME